MQEYNTQTGKSTNGDGRAVEQSPKPYTVASTNHRLNEQTSTRPREESRQPTKSGQAMRSAQARKPGEDGLVTRCELTIPDEDWKLWRAILVYAREKASLTHAMTKETVEMLLTRGGQQDAYNQRQCELPGLRKAQITYSVDISAKRLNILACRIRMIGKHGPEERVATRTSIAHHRRTGNTPWRLLTFCPESRILSIWSEICRDVPEDDGISFYEYPLKIAQKTLEVKKLHSDMEAAAVLDQENKLLLHKMEKEVIDLNARLEASIKGTDGKLQEKVSNLEVEVRRLQHENLVLENERRLLKRKRDSDESKDEKPGSPKRRRLNSE